MNLVDLLHAYMEVHATLLTDFCRFKSVCNSVNIIYFYQHTISLQSFQISNNYNPPDLIAYQCVHPSPKKQTKSVFFPPIFSISIIYHYIHNFYTKCQIKKPVQSILGHRGKHDIRIVERQSSVEVGELI